MKGVENYLKLFVDYYLMMSSSQKHKRKANETPVEAEVPDEDNIDEEESEESMVLVDGKSKFSFFKIICDILG